jgi:protein involved in polysaccharide export with SLBB domain
MSDCTTIRRFHLGKRRYSLVRFTLVLSWTFAILVLIGGCAADTSSRGGAAAPDPVNPIPAGPTARSLGPGLANGTADCSGQGSLRELWERREEQGGAYDFPIGPGDVLRIRVADLREFEDLSVRVSGDGAIDLPLVGNMGVTGMNEEQVRDAISRRVREFLNHPRVHVFVSQYHSRSVAVMGLVAKPGAYSLTGPSDSILNIIGRAGGMSQFAAQKVVLFPVEANLDNSGRNVLTSARIACADEHYGRHGSIEDSQDCRSAAFELASNALSPQAQDPPGSGSKGAPIVIDLTKPALAGCLDIPARPGDVVLIPAAGQVGVYGWVQKPGTFDVTLGMTVLGAVTAAGGAMFSSNAEILRTGPEGERTFLPLDLSGIESGRERDLPVEAGDVVLVKGSALGLVPYTLSTLLSRFGSGMYFAP